MIGKILRQKIFLAILIGLMFLIGELITMGDYNIMWDARNHFFKGQAFANFFLFGRKNYEGLPITKEYARYHRDYVGKYSPDPNIHKKISKDINYRRSIYQDDVHTFDWLMKRPPTEHPVLSDNMSAIFNIIFYEKLGWLRDDHGYALFGVALASILVGVFFYWISSVYGFLPAIVATLVLVTTPLFWAESHYNIKDTPLLVFFSISIWAFWQGIRKYSLKWIIFSSVIAGLALGTKFNALFLPVIIFPWTVLYLRFKNSEVKKKYFSWWWALPVYPLIMFLVLTLGWPQMWSNPISGFFSILSYYKEVGLNVDYTPAFRTVFNFSTYPTIWILLTTYPVVIILAGIGIIGSLINIRKTKDLLPILFLFWLVVPIARASLPNTSIFGGVRHIIEYIPPLSFFAGYGAYFVLKIISSKFRKIVVIIILASFIPFLVTLIRLHPAENVYFNSLIGGLQGAKKANITGWGNTDGGIYRKAVVWLNKNAQKNAHIAVAFSEPADFFIPELRIDLLADNLFSGYLQKGEYIVALTHATELDDTYRMKYSETFLVPLYVYSADGVPLIKIWKNEKKYLKKEFTNQQFKDLSMMPVRIDNTLNWKFKDKKRIMGVELSFEENKSCKKLTNAYFEVSEDGQNWEILPDTYPGGTLSFLGDQPKGNKLVAPIAGLRVMDISFVVDPQDSCIFNVEDSKVTILE